MSEKILVTGATGKLGSQLIQRLVEAGAQVKAGTRRPERAAHDFGGPVEVVDLDYDVTETWDAAVMWADRVFLVAPPFDPRADERLVPFLDWAVQSGSSHLVLVSAMGVETRERLALRRVEQRVEQTGVGWTFLRPNIYMQNFARGFIARSIREDGVFRLPAGDGAVSFVDVRDVADIAAAVLLDGEGHLGQAYTLTGPRALDHDDVAAILAEAAGRVVRYQRIDEAQMLEQLKAEGWAGEQARTFAALLGSIREGERAATTETVERLLSRTPGSFESFAHDHVGAWR